MLESKVSLKDFFVIFFPSLSLTICIFFFIVVEGYIWRFAKREGATIFFRGIRSWEKDGQDERALQILNTWGPLVMGPLVWPIRTNYLEGNPKYNHVSSTLIRQLCSEGKDVTKALSELVPTRTAQLVSQLYTGKDQ